MPRFSPWVVRHRPPRRQGHTEGHEPLRRHGGAGLEESLDGHHGSRSAFNGFIGVPAASDRYSDEEQSLQPNYFERLLHRFILLTKVLHIHWAAPRNRSTFTHF